MRDGAMVGYVDDDGSAYGWVDGWWRCHVWVGVDDGRVLTGRVVRCHVRVRVRR